MTTDPHEAAIEEIVDGAHWPDDLALSAIELSIVGYLNTGQISALDSFLRYLWRYSWSLEDVDEECLKGFGSLSRLERLARPLAIVEPSLGGTLRQALKTLRSKRWSALAKIESCVDHKERSCSLPEHEWPASWQDTMAALRKRSEVTQYRIPTGGGKVYAASVLRTMAGTVGQLAFSTRTEGDAPPSVAGVDALITAMMDRKVRAATLAIRLKEALAFARELCADEDVLERLRTLRNAASRRSERERKRKEEVLLHFEHSLGDIFLRAEELAKTAAEAPTFSDLAFHCRMDAAIIGLSCNAPLRAGDLLDLRIGIELVRSDARWRLTLVQEKNKVPYGGWIWPKVGSLIDGLVLDGHDHAALGQRLEALAGRYLFSPDGGRSHVARGWPSAVWRRHFGVGEHYIRSLWCTYYAEKDPENAWAASALLGHGSERTRRHYEVNVRRTKSIAAMQEVMEEYLAVDTADRDKSRLSKRRAGAPTWPSAGRNE